MQMTKKFISKLFKHCNCLPASKLIFKKSEDKIITYRLAVARDVLC